MRLIIIALLLSISTILSAQTTGAERKKHFNLENNLALQGYDPVAYFKSGKAVKGNPDLVFTYLGVTYQFATDMNRSAFKDHPEKYEPQYGGWCAFAMGDYGKKVEVDPETFKIVGGKLYLFYNAYFNNTLKSWNKNEKQLKSNADINWSNLIKK